MGMFDQLLPFASAGTGALDAGAGIATNAFNWGGRQLAVSGLQGAHESAASNMGERAASTSGSMQGRADVRAGSNQQALDTYKSGLPSMQGQAAAVNANLRGAVAEGATGSATNYQNLVNYTDQQTAAFEQSLKADVAKTEGDAQSAIGFGDSNQSRIMQSYADTRARTAASVGASINATLEESERSIDDAVNSGQLTAAQAQVSKQKLRQSAAQSKADNISKTSLDWKNAQAELDSKLTDMNVQNRNAWGDRTAQSRDTASRGRFAALESRTGARSAQAGAADQWASAKVGAEQTAGGRTLQATDWDTQQQKAIGDWQSSINDAYAFDQNQATLMHQQLSDAADMFRFNGNVEMAQIMAGASQLPPDMFQNFGPIMDRFQQSYFTNKQMQMQKDSQGGGSFDWLGGAGGGATGAAIGGIGAAMVPGAGPALIAGGAALGGAGGFASGGNRR